MVERLLPLMIDVKAGCKLQVDFSGAERRIQLSGRRPDNENDGTGDGQSHEQAAQQQA